MYFGIIWNLSLKICLSIAVCDVCDFDMPMIWYATRNKICPLFSQELLSKRIKISFFSFDHQKIDIYFLNSSLNDNVDVDDDVLMRISLSKQIRSKMGREEDDKRKNLIEREREGRKQTNRLTNLIW